ncbi:MAG: hypothetical protein M5R42_01585 [Rhodocyclaceae bacterium]|nr:hypothetical protein [Rhodocyclaceae bacterium]
MADALIVTGSAALLGIVFGLLDTPSREPIPGSASGAFLELHPQTVSPYSRGRLPLAPWSLCKWQVLRHFRLAVLHRAVLAAQ